MKINPTPQSLRNLFAPKPKKPRRLPGWPRDFIPRKSRRDFRNLTPIQQLTPEGAVASTRSHEVSSRDPLWDENVKLRNQVAKLQAEILELQETIRNLVRNQ